MSGVDPRKKFGKSHQSNNPIGRKLFKEINRLHFREKIVRLTSSKTLIENSNCSTIMFEHIDVSAEFGTIARVLNIKQKKNATAATSNFISMSSSPFRSGE